VTRQFLRFLVAGGIAAAANVLSRIGFSMLMGLEAAVVLAYCVGMLVAFLLMRSQVFPPSSAPVAHQVGMFAAVNVAAVLQTLVITLLLARWALPRMGVQRGVEEIAHIVGVCVPVVTSYFGHKHFSFRRTDPGS
jgi:putative flippase GtrA